MQQTPELSILRPFVSIELILFQNCHAPQATQMVTQMQLFSLTDHRA